MEGMTGLWFVGMVVVFVVCILWLNREWGMERQQLLDRIMARSYEEYAGVEVKQQEAMTKAEKKMKVVSVKELRDEMDREASEGIVI